MKTLNILLLLLIISSKSTGQESENYFITEKGEKINMYGKISRSPSHILYQDEKGKDKDHAQGKITKMVVYNRYFIQLPINSMMDRLQEVIAINENYILTAYWDDYHYIYVFDRNLKPVERKVKLNTSNAKKQFNVFNETVKKYFGGCDVLSDMEKNIKDYKVLYEGISYYKCVNAELFN